MWNIRNTEEESSLLGYSGSFPPVQPTRLLQDLVIGPTPPRRPPFTTQENGHGRSSSGGYGDGGNNGGGGGYGDNEESQPQPHRDLGNAAANLLLDRIRFLEQRGAPTDTLRIRQKPLSLPTPVKEVDGSIRTTSVYRWLRQVAKAVDELGLDRSYILYQLANESKLPAQWCEIFSGATDLESAFVHLRQRIPPLASCFPELVGSLTGKSATDGTNEAVIERCGEHLSSISDLVALFPDRSINREQLLACLASVGSTQQLQSQMVTTIRQMDQRQQLPPSDPEHLPYLEQLRIWLEGERNIRVDIIASIKVGKIATESVSTVTSFVTKVEMPGKVRIQPPRRGKKPNSPVKSETKKTNKPEVVNKAGGTKDEEVTDESDEDGFDQEHEDGGTEDEEVTDESDEDGFDQEHEDGDTESSEEEEDQNRDDGEDNMSCPSQSWWQPTQSCVICHQIPSHAPYLCGRLDDIKQNHRALPSSICSRCCNYIGTSNPHSEYCHLRSIKDQNGRKRWRSYLCGCNSGVHYRLCSMC